MIIKNGITYKNRKEWRLARGFQIKDVGRKYCPKCGIYLEIDKFKKLTSPSALRKYQDGYYWCCTSCYENITWVYKPGEEPTNRHARRRDKRSRRIIQVETTYGLSETQYIAKINEQKNLCAICGKKYEGKILCVDHDHNTSLVRGLLCNYCNIGLGNFKDNTEILQSAIAYLQKYSSSPVPPVKDEAQLVFDKVHENGVIN